LFETEKPPHKVLAIASPIYGTAVNKFVITVAAKKLICPQGKTYQTKAVAIDKIKIIIPEYQTNNLIVELLYDFIKIALNMCKYSKIKKKEAPLECIYLINQPFSTSRIIR
jgi:hypothetical protein